jgi:hypothetical protein
MFLSSKGVYIQKEELEYSDYSEESKNVVIFLAD